MDNEEDKAFLLAQKEKGRRGSMLGTDMKLHFKESKIAERKGKVEKRRSKEKLRVESLESSYVVLESSDEDPALDCQEEDNGTTAPSASTSCSSFPKKRARKSVMTSKLAEVLDRTQMSDRKAAFVLAATANSLGHSVNDIAISRSSIKRQREHAREDEFQKIKQRFSDRSLYPLVVHFDGKLLPSLSGKTSVNRLAVIVTGVDVHQLLGVPVLSSGTGETEAQAVAKLLHDWNIVDQVKAMCFDTTASNTGRHKGACVLLEQILEKNLLYLACRHHVYEIVLEGIFTSLMGPSSGPDVLLFKRFQQAWSGIDTSKYDTAITDKTVGGMLGLLCDTNNILKFAFSQLQDHQPRDDYRELLELVIIFLGSVPERGVHFIRPGALHRARWMAKGIYSLKIWMFKSHFKLTAHERKTLNEICVFLVCEYTKPWFTARLAASAPRTDLTFIQNLIRYKEVNPKLAEVALAKFSNHLWYLSEELISLAFFDSEVPSQMKQMMLESLKSRDGLVNPAKIRKVDISKCGSMTLADFVTTSSTLFFERLGMPSEFLHTDPETWGERDDFKECLKIVKHIAVVKDHAERGVALIQQFNSGITKSESQKQFLLQVVEEHRRRVGKPSKKSLVEEYNV